ncbi:hypothetical protein ACP4OV_024862 [Aristida adscensionis]
MNDTVKLARSSEGEELRPVAAARRNHDPGLAPFCFFQSLIR